jgi:hypothetical protein
MDFDTQNELKILDDSLVPLPPAVACTDCGSCLHTTLDRTVAGRRLDSADPAEQLLQAAPHSIKSNVQYHTGDYHILLPSPQNLYVAGLFAVHEGTGRYSLLQCQRDKVDLNAVRQVEAFLWALRKVNAYLRTVGGLQLGGLLLDTCNSKVRTMMLAAGLDAFNDRLKMGDDSLHVMAVVNALQLRQSKAANEILSRMNITSLSTGQAASVIDSADDRNQYILQVCLIKLINKFNTVTHSHFSQINITVKMYGYTWTASMSSDQSSWLQNGDISCFL